MDIKSEMKKLLGGKLGLHSILYVMAFSASVYMLTARLPPGEQWMVSSEIRFTVNAMVMIITLVLLTVETLNTAMKKKTGDNNSDVG